MKLKASLHLHSHEDAEDSAIVDYTLYELIDFAASNGFKVLASTCHGKNICASEHIEYARRLGILLIPGVEIQIAGHRHLLILNGGVAADKVGTFEELRAFRAVHPEAFIIAPHPNHGTPSTLSLKNIIKYRGLFDAVEHSWFYSKLFNPNRRAERLSKNISLPFIATADAHTLQYIKTDYAVIDAIDLSAASVFKAIRAEKFKNVTRPKTNFQLVGFLIWMKFRDIKSFFSGK